MCPDLRIEIDWERLEQGSKEEQATFGAIGIIAAGSYLTEAHDIFVRRIRDRVYLSGYQLAQWLAWNYWRLLWEPWREGLDWSMAHHLPAIGGGFVWPDITILGDGERTSLSASATPRRQAEPLQYVANEHIVLSTSEFVAGVESFVEIVIDRLRSQGVDDSNVELVWRAVQDEQAIPEARRYRRLEAAMGFDPDEGDEATVNALEAEGGALGERAIEELAAGYSGKDGTPRTRDLQDLLARHGTSAAPSEVPKLPMDEVAVLGATSPAWEVGEAAAKRLRLDLGMRRGPLSDALLSELAGTSASILQHDGYTVPFSFALDMEGQPPGVVLRSPFKTGRRFDLARLIGDIVTGLGTDPLLPILRSHTYRQKLQRAFAAELLLPMEDVEERYQGDTSDDCQERLARDFDVSPMLVATKLVNKGIGARDDLCRF